MEKEAFSRLNKRRQEEGLSIFANPRNSTAGSLKMQDPKAVAQRPIRFFAFDLIFDDEPEDITQCNKVELLRKYGFHLTNFRSLKNMEEVLHTINHLMKLDINFLMKLMES